MSVKFENRLPASSNRQEQSPEDLLSSGREYARRFVEDYPLAATLGVFGIGVGVGTMIGGVLSDQRVGRGRTAEAVGQRVLGAIKESLPDHVRSYLS